MLDRLKSLLSPRARSPIDYNVGWAPMNAWQIGAGESASPSDAAKFSAVYACWSVIAQEISRVPLVHVAYDAAGAKRTITNRAPARLFRSPNAYQTRSDLLLYIARSLLSDGNAYCVARRNSRFEIESLHPVPPRSCWPHIDPSTGDVYYQVGADANEMAKLDGSAWHPQRDILHIRLFTPFHPLIGESPLVAAAAPVAAGAQINSQVSSFFKNMARPSGIIRHPKRLDESTILRLKEKFMAATSGSRMGEPVVFSEDMQWQSLTMTAVDAQLVESFRLSERQIAQIYRIPTFLLGEDAKFATVEQLTKFFINSGLGFYFDHISDSFTKFLGLSNSEEILFDYEKALLSADFEGRMRGLEHATRSGVYSPNEARAREGLAAVEHGDEPRVQQQLVPLSFGADMQPAGGEPVAEPAAEPTQEEQGSQVQEASRRLLIAISG